MPINEHEIDTLWNLLESRDQTLSRAHETYQNELQKKEQEIQLLLRATIERLELIEKQRLEIESLQKSFQTNDGVNAVEILWRILESRDHTLTLANELIQQHILSIQKGECEQLEKEAQIEALRQTLKERLEKIERQHTELVGLRKSAEYRFGYALLNPIRSIRRLFRNVKQAH